MSTLRETPQSIEQTFRMTGGVSVVYRDGETWGHRETRSEQAFAGPGEVAVRREVVTIATGTLQGLKTGRAITVGGVGFEVLAADPVNDGAETEISLRAKNPRRRTHRGG